MTSVVSLDAKNVAMFAENPFDADPLGVKQARRVREAVPAAPASRVADREAGKMFSTLTSHLTRRQLMRTGISQSENKHIWTDDKAAIIDYRCADHPEEAQHFYCEDCERECCCGICCVSGCHKGHSCLTSQEAWDRIAKKIRGQYLPYIQDTLLGELRNFLEIRPERTC